MAALAVTATRAEIVEFRATINAAQETTGSTSIATGSAVLFYDVATNKFDLTVTLNSFGSTLTASHIHEAAPGVAGPVVTGLGAEAVYTRNGATLTATFTGVTHAGSALTLLQGGAYLNFHTAIWPGGEIRGQLIAQPKRLVAVLNGAQESTPNASAAYGAALITYYPATNKITTRLNVFNFTNTFTNSHYHEGVSGVAGPVVHGLGGAAAYTKNGTAYGMVFANQTYLGDPIKLLTGLAYLNVHSNIYPGGEIRGIVRGVDEFNVTRLINISARGYVGTGDNVLISGFVVVGPDPVRVLITGRGPSLTAMGVSGALANPALSLRDSAGREMLANDNYATTIAAADLAGTGFAPTDANEAAILVVLPPGLYSAILSGSGGSVGVGLNEVYESRPNDASGTLSLVDPRTGRLRASELAVTQRPARNAARNRQSLEFCVAAPLALATTAK